MLSASPESGELDWTKARELVRVATPETELAWVARAASVTSRVLEGEVATSLVGELPPSGDPDPERRPERQRVVFEMDSADAELLRTAIAAIRAVTHVGIGAGDRSSDSAILAGIALAALETPEAGGLPTGERYVVVLEHCPACRRIVSSDAEVSDAVASEAFCDAKVVEMRPGPDQGHLTRSGGKHGFDNLAAICSTHHRCVHESTLGVELKCELVRPSASSRASWSSRSPWARRCHVA